MMGQKGASLASTRKIHRKLARHAAEFRALVARKRERPGYDEATCLRAETLRLVERQLSGASPPVGVLQSLWVQVCAEANAKGASDAA